MKANNLHGEYCQNCAAALDDVQRNYRRVIVLDSQCAAVFHQSGDAARLDEKAKYAQPETIPAEEPKAKHETAKVQETVKKPAKASKR